MQRVHRNIMKWPTVRLTLCLLIPLLLMGSASATAATPVFAAAATMKFVLRDIAEAFQQDTGKNVRFSFASSGNLTRLIQQGAPFQLFFSANTAYVEQLQAQQLARRPKIVYALGRLALMTNPASRLSLDGQLLGIHQALQENRLQHFAIANPQLAPYGEAARDALQNLHLWPRIQDKLVIGDNAAQAVQFSASGAAQAGLVAYSLVLAAKANSGIRFVLIPQTLHRPLQQTMVPLTSAGDTAREFLRYMQQKKAEDILEHYGYSLP